MCTDCDHKNPSHPKPNCRHRYEHPEVDRNDFKKRREQQPHFASLREDFAYQCCYCTLHENEIGGWRSFQTEHFIPKIRRPDLLAVYTNLYYACHTCNQYKRADLAVTDGSYVNPCEGDLHTRHLVELVDGSFKGHTNRGKYMARRLRLGGKCVRKDLQRHLLARRKEERNSQMILSRIEHIISSIKSLLSVGGTFLTSKERGELESVKRDLVRLSTTTKKSSKDQLKAPPFP